MTGITEGLGGLPLPPGMSLRAIGPYPARRPALDAADRLGREHPEAEVRAVRLRDCDGLEAVVGGEHVSGTVAEVGAWLAGQAPADVALPPGYCSLCRKPASECRCDSARVVRNLLKDGKGRYIPGALFDWELDQELADPKTDTNRRTALAAELRARQFHEARLRGANNNKEDLKC